MRDCVMIIDDIEINRLILREILESDYDIAEAGNGREAIEMLFSGGVTPQAVLLDIMMPEMDGFQVLEKMKGNALTESVPVLFITAADSDATETRGLKSGASDFISKPFNPDVVKARVDNHIMLLHYQQGLEEMLAIKTSELVTMHERTLETLATIIEYRSLESGAHVRRTSALTQVLIEELLKDADLARELRRMNYAAIVKASALHDIGKVGISDSILLKPGKLTSEEFEVIKQHSVIGSDIMDQIASGISDDTHYLMYCRHICRSHHERWDGKGYPDGLKGADIPLAARILSVVDVYDALVNERCYKPPFSHEKAISIIQEGSGTQFDPKIVDALLNANERFRQVHTSIKDD